MSSSKSKREIIREKRREQKRRRAMTVIFIILAAAILFSAVVILPKLLIGSTKYENTNGFSMGDPDAPVTVVEFSSYTCGFCKSFSESYEADFISDYVEPGDVYFTYVNVPSNSEESLAAAEASYCAADQNKFFEYKDYLFSNAGRADSFSTDNLIKYAASADLNTNQFQTCLESDTFANAYLQDYEYAGSVGLSGTPSFLVNDTLVFSSDLIATVESYLKNNLQ